MTDPARIAASLSEAAKVEELLARRIAARSVGLPEGAEKRFLRSLWQFSKTRAGYLTELAHEQGD